MRNIKLTIEYFGKNYAGWQCQNSPRSTIYSPQPKTIQATMEKAIKKIIHEKVSLIGSGRTDAGVHALGQVANFRTDSDIPTWKLQKALNANLPDDIVITKVEDVNSGFHSRFSVKSKVYRYTILNRGYPSSLSKNTAYFYPYPLNVELMRKEAKCLLGKHDFKSFCASGCSVKDTVRTIKKITVKRLSYPLPLTPYPLKDKPFIIIDIEADGFLYNMVRNIAGTLIKIGRGKLPQGSVRRILLARDRRACGPTAPAKGLCLIRVEY